MNLSNTTLIDDFRSMTESIAARIPIPDIAELFLPPLFKDRQPHDSEFMAMRRLGWHQLRNAARKMPHLL
jgi:hypothetical protein